MKCILVVDVLSDFKDLYTELFLRKWPFTFDDSTKCDLSYINFKNATV